MEVEYDQTLEDHIAFNAYHQASQPWWRRNVRVLMLGILMLILTGFLLVEILSLADQQRPANRRGLTDLPASDQAFLLFVLACPLTFWAVLAWGKRYLVRWQITRLVRHPQNEKLLLGWRSCSIGPEGVTFRQEGGSGNFSWATVPRICQTEEYAFIYTTTYQAIIVPRRAFASAEEFQEFVATARAYRDAARDAS
jgi:hypothetical protein